MSILYLDDSGTGSYNDKDQPVLVYTGPLVDNIKYIDVKLDIENVIEKVKKEILWKLKKDRPRNYFSNYEYSILNKKIIGDKLEIHTSELKNGKDIYSFIPYQKRIQIIKELLDIIKRHNLTIYGVILDKDIIINKTDIDEKGKDDYMYKRVLKEFVCCMSNELKEDKAFIVVDAGNIGVNKFLREILIEDPNYRLMHEIVEVNSEENPFIQLADACAFIIASYHKMKNKGVAVKGSQDIENLYDLIKDNIVLYEVKDDEEVEIDE